MNYLSAQGVLSAASSAGASTKTVGVFMNRAAAELKAATDLETGICTPAQLRKGTRKAKVTNWAVSYDLLRRDIKDFEKWRAIAPSHTHTQLRSFSARWMCAGRVGGGLMMFRRTSPPCHRAIYQSSWRHVSATWQHHMGSGVGA